MIYVHRFSARRNGEVDIPKGYRLIESSLFYDPTREEYAVLLVKDDIRRGDVIVADTPKTK